MPLNEVPNKMLERMSHPLKLRFYLLYKLPAAFFSGIKIISCTSQQCITTVPYKWLTQNPFRSTYFASLAMAAEMSTGSLALAGIYKKDPPVSMLITRMEAEYFKKATGLTYFTCDEGNTILEAIQRAMTNIGGSEARVKSIGKNAAGELIAEFSFTWSFRVKNISS